MNKNSILLVIALLLCTFAQLFAQDVIVNASFDTVVTADINVNVTRFIYNLTTTEAQQEQLYIDIVAPQEPVSFSLSQVTPPTTANFVYLNNVALDQTLYQFSFTPSYTSNPIFNIVIHYFWAHASILSDKELNPESLRFTIAQAAGQTTSYTLFTSDPTVLDLLTTTASQPSASTIRNDFNSTEPIQFAVQGAKVGVTPIATPKPQQTPVKPTTSKPVVPPKSSGTVKPGSSQNVPQGSTGTPINSASRQSLVFVAILSVLATILLL